MISILAIGFLIGLQHALEADHVAAVASMASRNQSMIRTIRRGALWGVGHTVALLAVGLIIILMDKAVPNTLAHWLEFAVGVMLVLLGADVIRRLIKERVHFHLHQHEDSEVHIHAHSHRGEGAHQQSSHHHNHEQNFSTRVFAVGIMHGLAGSAALILLIAGTIESPIIGLLYIALFGFGSIVGMATLSFVIAIPLRYSAHAMTWAYNGLQMTIGIATMGLGTYTMYSLGIA
ncbi:sulfite exporter TauE/SafE family protein [Sneathiella marina]|uniref:Nickel/cobalt efflux system n=1 Tax=Sneathiella marina TaxID=2950108 RepID=A0ABY4W557_9PROT|nr:sulfite exporter TauE/SafE family protein [Sneathiella marina]USG60850.1 sulfite exporter TauE/SafE family protein [Sneathiella marina]